MTDNHSNGIERTEALLDAVGDDDSFVFLVGDEHGMDCTLEAGATEPTAVHIHLLATHIRALSDATGDSPDNIVSEALAALQRMENGNAVAVSYNDDEEVTE